MPWHILWKDLRLLRVLALTVGGLPLGAELLRVWVDLSARSAQIGMLADVLSALGLLGVILLTAAAMHQDPVPGVRQDWVVQPVARGDLVLAKLLFILLIVQGPVLLADLVGGLAHGFAPGHALEAALARNLAVLCLFTLPAAMLGVVTRSMTELLVVALTGFVALVVIFTVGGLMLLGLKVSIPGTGVAWISAAIWYVLVLVGAPGIIALQYHGRRTRLARVIIGASASVIFLSAFFPWRIAFALQEKLAPAPLSAGRIAVTFEPQRERFRMPPAAAPERRPIFYVPLRVTGVPASAGVLMERALIRIQDAAGKQVYSGRTHLSVDGFGSMKDAQFEVRQGRVTDADARIYQRIFLPAAILANIHDQPVSLDIELFLTLYQQQGTYSLPAAGGRAMLEGLGACETRVDSEGDDVQLRCTSTARAPSCFTAYLEQTPTGLRNPEAHGCDPDYSPIDAHVWPDALSRSGGELPFFDRSGLIHYPIDGSQLASSRLVVEVYTPRDHFVRHVSVRSIRLADLSGVANPSDIRP
jgi:hypothetical protein